jgi:DNA polymerase elongation subunit (family B)
MSMVGVLHPEGISKVDYIRDAIKAYNHYIENQIIPKVQRLNSEVEEPLSFFIDTGLDVDRW